MQVFKTLSQDALLLALTEYYEKYRKIIEQGGDEEEFITCKFTLAGILGELSERRVREKVVPGDQRDEFEFKRIKN